MLRFNNIYEAKANQSPANPNEKILRRQIDFFVDSVNKNVKSYADPVQRCIDSLLADKFTLELELEMDIPIGKRDENTSLIDYQMHVETILQEFRAIKIERLHKLKIFQRKERLLCEILNINPKYSTFEYVPSTAELESIKDYLADLKNIKTERWTIFLEQRANIESMFSTSGIVPTTMFEKLVLDDLDLFQLSESNMDELQKLLQHLSHQIEKQKSKAMALRDELNSLCDFLQIDVNYREKFINTKTGYNKNVISQLKSEVIKCNILKTEGIEQYTDNLRVELNNLWNKCNVGELQREKCHAYYMEKSDVYIIDMLKIEIDNVKEFYADNIYIYNLIKKRNYLWKKMMKTLDPVRFSHNRFRQLLKQKKERKIIQMKLARVENELKMLLHFYEQQRGKPFMFKDEILIDYIDNQWNKIKRGKKRSKQTQMEIEPQTLLLSTPQDPKDIFTETKKSE